MPTGIEEFFAAVAAAAAQGAALAPFTGSTPTASTTASSDAAAGASEPILSVEMMEGEAVVTNAGPAASRESGSAPVTGDRPAASTSTADAAPGERRSAWDFDPAFLNVDKGATPSGQPPGVQAPLSPPADPQPAPSSTGTSRSGTDTAPPPGSPPVPNGTPTYAAPPGAPPSGTPTISAPAAAPVAAGPAPTAQGGPPAVAPGSAPPAAARTQGLPAPGAPPGIQPEPDIEVPADFADYWERHSRFTPARLIFGRSGEDLAAKMKKEVRNVVGAIVVTSDDPEESEGVQIIKQAHAAAIQTVADVVIDAGITPILDPGAQIRGILRTGTATPTGIEEVRQGQTPQETALGAAKVVGEVSGVVLMVVAPIDAGMAKGATPTLGEPSVTMLVEKAGPGLGEQVTGGHVRLEIRTAGGDLVTTDALATSTEPTILPSGAVTDVEVVNQARVFDTPSPEPAVMSHTVPLPAAAADEMAAAAQAAAEGQFMGVQGGLGVWNAFGQHCGTYAAAIARAGGMPVVGIFGSRIAFQMFKGSGIVTAPAAAGIVHAGVENTNSRGSDAVPP